MSCGTPVVTSDIPALREICGGAAVHIPVDEASGMGRTVQQLMADTDLRDDLIRRGREQARQFTWDRSCRVFLKVLERAVTTGC